VRWLDEFQCQDVETHLALNDESGCEHTVKLSEISHAYVEQRPKVTAEPEARDAQVAGG
jgi:hypothetical protein